MIILMKNIIIPPHLIILKGLTKEERNAAYTNELFFQKNKSPYNQTKIQCKLYAIRWSIFKSLGPVSGIQDAERKALDREKVNHDFWIFIK